jgi:prolipoprotein diacylglyceryltransferase
MLPVLQIGPLAIQLPGLLLLAGVWVGSSVTEKQARRLRLPVATLSNMIFLALLVGLLSARLWYALRYLSIYLENPLGVLALNPSTLAPAEGALTGMLAAVIYAQRRHLPLWATLDALAPGLAVFAVAYGFTNLASGDGFGAPSDLPWAIELWGAHRHPTQIYEILLAGLIFASIRELGLRPPFPFSGFLFLAWVALAAVSRLFLEAFRGDSVIVLGILRSAQLVSLGVLLGAMLAMHLGARNRESQSA